MEKEGQEPYDFAHTWDTKQKATNKHNKKLTDTENSTAVTRGERGWGEVGKGKGGQDQIHGGGGRRNFGR